MNQVEDSVGYQSAGAGYYAEPPQLMAGNLSAGVRLLCAALVSFFGAFLFTYLYLKETDSGAIWRAAAVKVPTGTGIAIIACVLASALMTAVAQKALRSGGIASWRSAAIVSELLALAALGVQCYQWATLSFGPGSGPYASVFVAWTGFYAGVGLTSAIYWAQTMVASSIKHGGSKPGPVAAVEGTGEQAEGGSGFIGRLGVEAGAFAFFWYFLAGVEVVTFVLLYLVA